MPARDTQKAVVGQTARGMICPPKLNDLDHSTWRPDMRYLLEKCRKSNVLAQFQDVGQIPSTIIIQSMIRTFYSSLG